jgi:hypothetical protein
MNEAKHGGRHPVNAIAEQRICPVTGERFYQSWSRMECYDSCDSCRPGEFRTVGERLADLQRKRIETGTDDD